ncbi:MAG: hypothetical protein IKS44_07040 [Bacteroidales bacterium]|nr:hypothetical protein [Bacteroidales bacterium]
MQLYLVFLCALVAVLATMALMGYIFYRITKRYFDNQQKEQMLQMRIDEHREAVKQVTPPGAFPPGAVDRNGADRL